MNTGSSARSSSFDVGKAMSVSGLFVILAGALLLLLQSTHWVRTFCFLFLYVTLYLGAVDSLLLRIHSAALAVGPRATRVAAAAEVAATRWHPITAVRSLVDTAMTGDGMRVRRAAMCALERRRMRSLLPHVDGWRRKIQSLANGTDLEVSASADRILEAFRREEEERRRRRKRGR